MLDVYPQQRAPSCGEVLSVVVGGVDHASIQQYRFAVKVMRASSSGPEHQGHQDGDDNALILAHFPKVLPVMMRSQNRLYQKCISMGENKQARNSAHGSIIPVRKGNGTSELWYTIPYHLQPNNTRTKGTTIKAPTPGETGQMLP